LVARHGPSLLATGGWLCFVGRTIMRLRGSLTFVLYDDGMISMTYARTWARTGALTWFPGAPKVEGFSNPLWTAGMALVHLMRIPDRLVGGVVQLVGLGLLLWCVSSVGQLVTAMGGTAEHRRAARWLSAAFWPMAYWAAIGMEVSAVAALMLAFAVSVALATEHVEPGGRRTSFARPAVLLTLAVLVRTDALVLALPFLSQVVRVHPRRRLLPMLLPAVGLAGTTLARRLYFADWVPNTFRLKGSGVLVWDQVKSGSSIVVAMICGTLLPIAALAVIGTARRGSQLRRHDIGRASHVAVGITIVYVAWIGGDFMDAGDGHALGVPDRFMSTAVPFLLPAAASGLIILRAAARRASARMLLTWTVAGTMIATLMISSARWAWSSRWSHAAAVDPAGIAAVSHRLMWTALIATLLAATAAMIGRRRAWVAIVLLGAIVWTNVDLLDRVLIRDDFAVQRERARVGDALRQAVAPGTTVAVAGAGSIVYFSGLPAVDELGKSDRRIAKGPIEQHPFIAGHSKWDAQYSLVDEAPDLILERWGAGPEIDAQLTALGYRALGTIAGVGSSGPLVRPGTELDAVELCRMLSGTYYACDG